MEMEKRKIKCNINYLNEIQQFCCYDTTKTIWNYPEHNERYFIQCYYNLQEKYDRGIITDDEWHEIKGAYYKYFGEV